MRANRRRDTTPELRLRRELHRRGLRYRVDRRVPGGPPNRIDLVFARAKVAVEVYGCFWHQCPMHATHPKTNDHAWAAKFAANRARDDRVRRALEQLGWRVEIVWEHEDSAAAADRIQARVLDALATEPASEEPAGGEEQL